MRRFRGNLWLFHVERRVSRGRRVCAEVSWSGSKPRRGVTAGSRLLSASGGPSGIDMVKPRCPEPFIPDVSRETLSKAAIVRGKRSADLQAHRRCRTRSGHLWGLWGTGAGTIREEIGGEAMGSRFARRCPSVTVRWGGVCRSDGSAEVLLGVGVYRGAARRSPDAPAPRSVPFPQARSAAGSTAAHTLLGVWHPFHVKPSPPRTADQANGKRRGVPFVLQPAPGSRSHLRILRGPRHGRARNRPRP